MRNANWTTIILLIVVGLLGLLVVGSLFPFGWGGWGNSWAMMSGRNHSGMMGGWGFSPVGWLFSLVGMLIPFGLLALLIVGSVWLIQQLTPSRPSAAQHCSNCDRATQSDWQICPYCSDSLTPPAANTV